MTKKKQLPDLENLAHTIPGVVYRIDLTGNDLGRIVFTNKKIEDISGHAPDEFLSGKVNWLSLVLEEDRPTVLEKLATNSHEPLSIEYRIKNKSGNIRWVLNQAITIWEKGKPRWCDGVILDITDAKTNELELLGQKTELNNLVSSISDLVLVIDAHGRFKKFYTKDTSLLMLPPAAFLNKTIPEAFAAMPEYARLFEDTYRNTVAQKEKQEIEYSFQDGDKLKWFCARFTNLEKPGEVSVLVSDLTVRKNTELALKENEQILQWTSEVAKIGGWEINLEKRTIRWSDEVYKIRELNKLSYEPSFDEALDYYPPETRPVISQAVNDGIEKGIPWDLELPLITAKGNKKWVRNIGIPETVNGKCVALRGVMQDITKRKNVESQLKEKEQRLDMVLKGANLGTWDWDHKKQITTYNECWARMLGYTLEEIKQNNLSRENLIHPDDLPLILKAWDKNLSGVPTYSETEYRLRHKDGHWVWVFDRGTVVERDAQGEVLRASGIHMDITVKKNAEHSLKQNEQLLRWASETAKIGGWEFDIAKRTVRWSDEIYKIREVEKSHKDFSLEWITKSYEPEARTILLKATDDALMKGTSWDLELPIITPKGNKKWIRNIGIPEMVNGKCVSLRGVQQDITERKNAEAQLQEREQQLKLAIKGANLGTWSWNIVTGQEKFNDQFFNLIGYSPEEIEQHFSAWKKLVHPDDVSYILENLQVHLNGKTELYESEHRFKHKNGQWVWVLARGKVVERDANGKPLRASGTYLDITERKNTEMKNFRLQVELEEFKSAVSAASIVAIADPKGIIKYANQNFVEISQYTQEELIGRNHNIVNSGHHPKSFWREMWQTIAQGRTWRGDVKNRRKDGTFYWVDTFIMPLHDSENKIIEYLSIRNDITEKKENEVKLQLALQRAEESDRLKSAFLANMSHEIRTPMNAIMGFSELLERPVLSDQKRVEFSRLISERSRDLLNIVNDILDISKIKSGQISSVRAVGNVNELFDRLLLTFHADVFHLRNKNISIQTHNELKPGQAMLVADFLRLYQVLNNLITNACKFTNSGSIEFGCQFYNPHTLLFWVKDTGIGIAPEQFDIIFRPFRQATVSTHEKFGGTGLGLAICKGLVELWGGKIWVESKVDAGSTFYFTMPYVPASEHQPHSPSKPQAYWADKKVLLVEDDLSNASYFMELLAPTGLKVVHVSLGKEALHQLSQTKFDVAVLDIELPDISGFDVAASIKKNHKGLPSIALTAYGNIETKLKADEIGFDYFLAKPVTKDKLLPVLERALKKVIHDADT